MLLKRYTHCLWLVLSLFFLNSIHVFSAAPIFEWMNMDPSIPSPRSYASMAYDSANNRIILFGGSDNNYDPLNDTWSYDVLAEVWTQLYPLNSPPARNSASMVYDSATNRFILFGGIDNNDPLNDTWSYDFSNNTWTDLNPASSPSPRHGASMAYDSVNNRIILFGGYGNSGYLNDTWSYDAINNTWTDLNPDPASPPPVRNSASMAYDSVNNRIILFGGYGNSGPLNDTWSYDATTNTWIDLNPASPPSPRNSASISYVSVNNQIILFGGYGNSGYLDDTWSYDFSNNTWTDLNPASSPSPRYGASMAYDSANNQIILFGGQGNEQLNDTWSYDNSSNTWSQKNPLVPLPREKAAIAYDSSQKKIILFGGGGNSGLLDDTWSYDAANRTWVNLNPALPPSPRYAASMVYDSANKRIILFGGDGNSGYLDDTWSYDVSNNTWTDLNPASPPSPRYGASMTYDSANDRILLFGGSGNSGRLNDTWSYDANNNTWTDLNPASPPSARYYASMAYDSAINRNILFGGNGNSGRLDDTWLYDNTTNTWSQANPFPVPSPLARSEASMVYDPTIFRTVLFGGDSSNGFLNDTWLYNSISNSWTEINPSPLPRESSTMAYDLNTHQMILFGGDSNANYLNDTWSLTVTDTTIQITSADKATFKTGIFSSFIITTTGSPPPTVSASGLLPSGIVFQDNGNGTATLSGIPQTGSGGNYSILFTAENGVGCSAQQNFTLTIEEAPAITSLNHVTFTAGVYSSFIVMATGFPTPSITATGTLPSGVTFVDHGNGLAILSGTPTSDSAENYSFIITATNGVSPDAEQIFILEVTINPAPPRLPVPTNVALEIIYPCGNKSGVDQSVDIIANVEPFLATGTVTFYDGEKILGTVPLTEGTATLTVSFSNPKQHNISAKYSGNQFYHSSYSSVKTVPVKEILHPQNVEGFQQIKKSASKIAFVNVIKWKAPDNGLPVASYRIYRTKKMGKAIGIVAGDEQLIFKERKCNPCKVYKYYIVSTDRCGNTSKPAFVKIKGNHYCPSKN